MFSRCYKKKLENVSVDSPEEQKKNPKLQKFSVSIFLKGEWPLLKTFCRKYGIKQIHLVTVFQAFLSHEEVYIRKFRVRLNDPKLKYAPFSPLMQELADVYFPAIFLKEFPRLAPVLENPEEVTFSRFIIMSYLFGCQQVPDLIYDFFAILRKNLIIPVTALIAIYSYQQVCLLLIEDLQSHYGTYKYLKKAIQRLDTTLDLRLSTCIALGMKYPLLVYSLVRFRKYFQRFIFGDHFWKDRKYLKIKSVPNLLLPIEEEMNQWFEKEEIARKMTARAFIMDAIYEKKAYELAPIFYDETIRKIRSEEMIVLIEVVGYKAARRLTIEAEIMYDQFDPAFLVTLKEVLPSTVGKGSVPNTAESMQRSGGGGGGELEGSVVSSSFGDLFYRPGSPSAVSTIASNLLSSLKPMSPQALMKTLNNQSEDKDGRPSSISSADGMAKDRFSPSKPSTLGDLSHIKQEGKGKEQNEDDSGDEEEDDSFHSDEDDDDGEEEEEDGGKPGQYKRSMSKRIHNLPDADHYTVVHDNSTDHEFVYDVATGRTNWVRVLKKQTGRVMRKLVTTALK